MRHTQIILAALAVLCAAMLFYGCDRLKGDADENQAPVVQFVNTPVDTSSFNYAPVVYWIGYDPDGLIAGYEYYDDSTEAAREAYRRDRETPGTLLAYINAIPADNWVRTSRTQETIFLGTAAGETKEHVFIVRAIDNLDKISLPKVRTFFRTNFPPDPPLIKWAMSADDVPYRNVVQIPETLFWGDTINSIYAGVEILWQGSDPDSRELNVIPLEFSYVLVRLPNDTIDHPIYDDSLNVIGYEGGWSPWSGDASIAFYGQESGDYEMTLRVRDDGLTTCRADSFAHIHFVAVKPSYEYQLLIVDETATPTNSDINNFGARSDTAIMNFYYDMIPDAFELANMFRNDSLLPTPFATTIDSVGSGSQIQEFNNKDVNQGGYIPYALIGQFKWVWVIHDNNKACTNNEGALQREHVMDRYLRVGGQLMLSGRRLFTGGYLLPEGPEQPIITDNGQFFAEFFNLNSAAAKSAWNATSEPPEFAGATTPSTYLPDLRVNSAVCSTLNWRGRRYGYLPEIDYFGRAELGPTSTDYSVTLYNYNSATRNEQYDTTGVDCIVYFSTPSYAMLKPAPGHAVVFDVSRIYNVTRDAYAQFLWIDHIEDNDTALIVCSTPELKGAWQTSDVLEVDYVFSPISVNHNKPVACQFQKHEVVPERDPRNPNANRFKISVLYRTALYTFPFSFLDRTPVPILPGLPDLDPVAYAVAAQILTFNESRDVGDFDREFVRQQFGVGPRR